MVTDDDPGFFPLPRLGPRKDLTVDCKVCGDDGSEQFAKCLWSGCHDLEWLGSSLRGVLSWTS